MLSAHTVQETFPEDWKNFNAREKKFFSPLRKQRVVSGLRSIVWMLGRQLGLLHPRGLCEVGMFTWIPWPRWVLRALSALGYFAWALAIFGAVYAFYCWGPYLLRAVGKAALKWITG